jgi:hypothetical protein
VQGLAPITLADGDIDLSSRSTITSRFSQCSIPSATDNIDELIKQQLRLPYPLKLGDELTLYLDAELETDDGLVSFQYWLRPAHRAKYPSLARMAIDILSVPAKSAEAERVFSSAGFVLNSRGRRLREETLEAMLCLTHWSKLGLITLAKHRNDAVRGNDMAELQYVSSSSTSSEGL